MHKFFTTPDITPANENFFIICKDLKNPSRRLVSSLNLLRGINTPANEGYHFKEALMSSIAYFFQNIYGRMEGDNFKRYKTSPEDYTIEKIKSYFDNCSMVTYTPRTRIVGEYKELHQSEFFNECYFVIQVAYFLATYYGEHQYIEYVKHYQETKEKLPEHLYKYDLDVLHKKYKSIDEGKTNIDYEKKLWYFSILEVMLDELNINNPYYPKTIKPKDGRYYNPLALTARPLRKEQPFLMALVDIAAAYPTMIDKHVGSNLSGSIYENIAKEYNISRNEAKVLFNKKLNSGMYRMEVDSMSNFYKFLLKVGYTETQTEKIITELTDDVQRSFYSFAVQIEREIIEGYKKEGELSTRNATRVHDALYFVLRNDISYKEVNTKYKGFTFKYEQINDIIIDSNFHYSNRFIKNQTFAFLPKNIRLAYHKTIVKPKDKIGRFEGFMEVGSKEKKRDIYLDIEFFKKPEVYLTANFKTYTHDWQPTISTLDELKEIYYKSLSLLQQINNKKVTDAETLRTCFWHHRKYSNLCFDVESMVSLFLDCDIEGELPTPKERDFIFYNNIELDESNFYLMGAIQKARQIVKEPIRVKQFINDFQNFLENGTMFSFIKDDLQLNKFKKLANTNIFGISHEKKSNKYAKVRASINDCYIHGRSLDYLSDKKIRKQRVETIEKQKVRRRKLKKLQLIFNQIQKQQYPKELDFMHEKLKTYYNTIITTTKEQHQASTPESMPGAFFDQLRERIKKSKETLKENATSLAYAHLFCDDSEIEHKKVRTNVRLRLANIDKENLIKSLKAESDYNRLLQWYKYELRQIDNYPKEMRDKYKTMLTASFISKSPYNKQVIRAEHIKKTDPQLYFEKIREIDFSFNYA
jgi:hypothetical protein